MSCVLCLQIFWIITMAAANDHVVDNFDKDLDEEEVRLYTILQAFDDGTLDEEEFLVLYFKRKNMNKENPTFQYWKYEFNFEGMTDDECKSEFRFLKSDIPRLSLSPNGIQDAAQLAIFIRDINSNFEVMEELVKLEQLMGTTTGQDILDGFLRSVA